MVIANVHVHVLRLIYTVQLCLKHYAYDKSTTQVVPCKSSLLLAIVVHNRKNVVIF